MKPPLRAICFFLGVCVAAASGLEEAAREKYKPVLDSDSISTFGGFSGSRPLFGFSYTFSFSPVWAWRASSRGVFRSRSSGEDRAQVFRWQYTAASEILIRWPEPVGGIFRSYWVAETAAHWKFREEKHFVSVAGRTGWEIFLSRDVSTFLEVGFLVPVWNPRQARVSSEGQVFIGGSLALN